MAKVKSPEQVCRIDGRNCFVELLTIGLGIDKIVLNFVNYDTSAGKGSRVGASIMTFLGVHDAEVLADNVLSGQMFRKGEQAKKLAAEKGYKYAKEVFCSMTGTPAAKASRSDGAASSRQLKLSPGAKQPWVLSAESGPGREEGTGIIAPAYVGGRPECIIRIPMGHDTLKSLALSIKNLVGLWYEAKFLSLAQEAIPKAEPHTPAFIINKGAQALQVFVDSLAIDQFLLDFNSGAAKMYLNVFKTQVLANDILSGKISKAGAAAPGKPVYTTYGGGRRGSDVYCRVFTIHMDEESKWALHTESGPGKLSDDGMILPNYDKPDREASVIVTQSELLELGFALRGLAQAWMDQKFGALVSGPIEEARLTAQKELDAIRSGA